MKHLTKSKASQNLQKTSRTEPSESQLPCLYVMRGGYSSFKNPLKRRLAEAADDNREPSTEVCTQVRGVLECLNDR